MKNLSTFLEPRGVSGLSSLNEMTDLIFVSLPTLVKQGVSFGFHTKEEGVFDFCQGELADGVTLGELISSQYPEDLYGIGINRWLINNYSCYVEVPTMRMRNGVRMQAYDKHIATSNIDLVVEWMDDEYDLIYSKFASRIDDVPDFEGTEETPYVKLYQKSGEPRITRPRKNLDLTQGKMRVIPMDFLVEYTDLLVKKMKEEMVEVKFEKDNGQLRTIITTLNREILEEIYGKGDYVDTMLLESFDGNWNELSTLERGYIKVPEVGSSIYDSGTRSINFARIRSVKYDPKPDLSFVKVDINAVVGTFIDVMANHATDTEFFKQLIETMEMFNMPNEGLQPTSASLIEWAENQNLFFTSEFQRSLHQFMISNPNLFPGYTGERELSKGEPHQLDFDPYEITPLGVIQ